MKNKIVIPKEYKKIINKNVKIYGASIDKNIKTIEKTLKKFSVKSVPIEMYQGILSATSSMVTTKWETGRKYTRTAFTQRAFDKKYPVKNLEISLAVDAMVNLLDDLLDEKLSDKEKEQYVVEFLRVFAIYSKNNIPSMNAWMGDYINKLITLAVAEQVYQGQILKEKNLKELAQKSKELLTCRGVDIEIFVQIALSAHKVSNKTFDKMLNIARIFRGMNILKKDIHDIDHDIKIGNKTAVLLVLDKKEISFGDYAKELTELLLAEQEKNIQSIDKELRIHKLEKVAENFKKMAIQDQKEILKKSKNL